MSFGQVISKARKMKGLSQKDLAGRIRKKDGGTISPQYLNDIEHDRRNAPPDPILHQLANELGLSIEYLHYIAGVFPEDLREMSRKPEEVMAAFRAFRRALKGK